MTDPTTQLPPETWLIIMDLLADNLPEHNFSSGNEGIILQSSPDIRTVSTLSRYLNQLANPYRFRNANITVDASKSPELTLHRIEEFLDLLERRPEVKTWIRILSIGQTSRSDSLESVGCGEKYLAVEARVYEVVPELRNLSTLRCGFMSFPSSLFSGVLQLPQLEQLELHHCQLHQSTAEHTTDWSIMDQNKSSIRSLVVTTLEPPAIQTAAALRHLLRRETLAELITQSLSSDQEQTTLLEVTSTHIPDYVFKGLRRLAIRLSSADVEAQRFVDLGARCPNLTTLSLKIRSSEFRINRLEDGIKRSGVTSHHFPALQRFEGHLLLAPIFTEGRPVHTVIGDTATRRDLMNLAPIVAALKPSVPLRVLHLATSQWSDGDIEAVAQHHPELEELVYKPPRGQIMRWSPQLEEAFRKFSVLKRITLRGEMPLNDFLRNDAEGNHPMITKFRNLCPSLELATISGVQTWRLRPECTD